MQDTDSTIMPTQKRSLTDSQEKFLDALFGEARGNPKKAGELAGYSEHSYPKVLRNLKSEIVSRAENYLATHSAKAATKIAIHTVVEIFSFKNKKPKRAVMKGIAAKHNNVTAAEVLVIDHIKVIMAVPRPIPPIIPEIPTFK